MSQATMQHDMRPHGTDTSGAGAARPRGWWARNWIWALLAGLAGLGALIVTFVVLIMSLVFGMLRGTDVYRTAYAEARSNLAVVAAIGTPIEDGWMCGGNIEMTPASGSANLVIPIAGPAGSATIHVVAEKSGGAWMYETLEVAVHDTDETIDLLADR